jgi:hypothetical protein
VNPFLVEVANDPQRLLEDDNPQEQSPTSKDSVAWQGERPLSWSDFQAILVSYCNARQWKILCGEEDDMSLAIFAHQEQATDGAEALQERLPFENDSDALPF